MAADEMGLDAILEALRDDPDTRDGVVRALARDFPSEYLAPVRVNLGQLGVSDAKSDMRGLLISNKEWQE